MSTQPSKIDFLIETVKEIKAEQDEQGKRIYEMHGKVSKLEAISGFFGMVGGALVALIAYVKGH
jgi:hypothetical protein